MDRRELLKRLMSGALALPLAFAVTPAAFAKDGGKGGGDHGGDDGDDDGGDDDSGDDGGDDDGGDDDSGSDDSGNDDSGSDDSGSDDSGSDDGGDSGSSGNSGSGSHSGSSSSSSDGNRQGREDHDQALAAKQQGHIIPLKEALKTATAKYQGKVIDVKLFKSNSRQIYAIKIRKEDGTIRNVRMDARTGRIAGIFGF